jgi:hypothetical protein
LHLGNVLCGPRGWMRGVFCRPQMDKAEHDASRSHARVCASASRRGWLSWALAGGRWQRGQRP